MHPSSTKKPVISYLISSEQKKIEKYNQQCVHDTNENSSPNFSLPNSDVAEGR